MFSVIFTIFENITIPPYKYLPNLTFRDFVTNYYGNSWKQQDQIVSDENQSVISRSIFIKNPLHEKIKVTDIDQKLSTVTSNILIQVSIIGYISEDTFDLPIVYYLNKNNIMRACWKLQSNINPDMFVDVKQTFSHYNNFIKNRNSDNKIIEFVGHLDGFNNTSNDYIHQKNCDKYRCDIITCYSKNFCSTTWNRNDTHECVFLHEKYERKISLYFPTFCDKLTIINTFILYNKMNEKIDVKFTDLDLYFVVLGKTDQKYVKVFSQKITHCNDFVTTFCCDNEGWFDKLIVNKSIYFAIVSKKITSSQFNDYMNFPTSVLNIIHQYVDFQCKLPSFWKKWNKQRKRKI